MNMNYDSYILPINGVLEGTGVLVGDLLITAGHVVVGGANPFVVISGESYHLTSDNTIYVDDNPSKSSDGYDLAVYRLKGVESPLILDENMPNKNTLFS